MDPRPKLGPRAAALGHNVTVGMVGKRFRLECSCGFRTQANWKRMTTFDALTAHLTEVVRTGVSIPSSTASGL